MTSRTTPSSNTAARYIQPQSFANYLSNQHKYCLFLDIDGTLADFTINPKDSVIPPSTLALLQIIQDYGVQIAMVTGRSLAEAKHMVSPLELPIAATHGLEISFGAGDVNPISIDTSELTTIKQTITQLSQPYTDFTVENKPYSCALHYRQNPTLAEMAYSIMSETVENYVDWTLKQGKYVWEVVPKGVNKGTAILTLLDYIQQELSQSDTLYPIFIGDDITDEAGFIAVQGKRALNKEQALNKTCMDKTGLHKNSQFKTPQPLKGMGIKVGSEPTRADYYVHDINEVVALLKSFLSFCQEHYPPLSDLTDTIPLTTPSTALDKKTAKKVI